MVNTDSTNLPYKTLVGLSIVCSLIIPLLLSGPFIPDLIISILSIYFLYFLIKNKIFNIFDNKYFKFFLLFWLFCIISSLMSDNVIYSLKSSFFYIRIAIFSLLLSYLIEQHEKILDYFYFSFLFTFTCIIIDGIFQYYNGFNLLGQEIWGDGTRVSSFFGDHLILGSYLVRLLPLCIALFFVRKNKNKWEYYFFPIFLIFVSILIFLSGERTSFFYLILISFFLIFFLRRYKLIRTGILIVSLIFISFLLLNSPKFQERYIKNPINSLSNNDEKIYFFTPSHDSLIRTSWKMFLDKPIIGHGPKLFRFKCNEKKYSTGIYACSTHPHNFYIQLLAETGFIGFMFLLISLIFFCYIMIKHIIRGLIDKDLLLTDYQICLLAGVLITIWPLSPNGNIFNNNLMIIYGLQIGFFKKRFEELD